MTRSIVSLVLAHALARGRSARRATVVMATLAITFAAVGCGDPPIPDQGSASDPPPQARLRVRVDTVKLAPLSVSDRLTGTVRAYHRATITAEAAGRVLARSVEPGARVEADGVLIELEASRYELALRQREASLAAARTVLAHAEREFARGERLLSQKAISTQQHDDLRHAVDRGRDELALAKVARDTAKRDLADTRIRAPFAGTVDALRVDVGDFVSAGSQVATLVDLSRVRVFAGVTAREAARLSPGLVAKASFADLGGAVFDATLQSISRVASESDGTYTLELWIETPDERLRDGLVAALELPDPDPTPRLLARRAALMRRDGHPEVFVIEGKGEVATARTRRVRTGRSAGEWVEIVDGLSAGDRVVWDGQFALAEGVFVTIDGEG